MKRILIITGIVLAILIAGMLYYTQIYTRSFSPAANVDFNIGNTKVKINYCQPSKREREIFGNLVPYGKTWRTGANQPTTFETSGDLKFGEKDLKAGKYSLWTVPGEQNWQIVFNSEIPL